MPQGQRIVSKSDLLVLHRPQHSRRPLIYVRVSVDQGMLRVQKCSRRCAIRPSSVNGEYDLKVIWVTNDGDVLDGNVRNSFEVITPEKCYILQADTHRAKIEWMQALSIGTSQCLRFRGSYRPTSWTNLEDLQVWLSVREVQYEYRDMEEFRGAVYTGKWEMGKPHGIGSLEWPDGRRYDGEFVKGIIEGTGTMLWISDKHKRSYTGSWKNCKMEGNGEMTYLDGSVYTGWWCRGMRCGHGRMEYREPESLYIGGWENDMREGYGVFHNSADGEHYLGMWQSNKFHGPGILIGKNEAFYSGQFREGEKMGSPTAAVLEQDDKWIPLFRWSAELLEQMVTISHSNPDISHGAHNEDQRALEADADMYSETTGRSIGVAPDIISESCQDCHSKTRNADNECLVCRIEGFRSADHPFGILVNNLTKCFIESYSGIAQHPKLLPHAIGELTSITTRLHQLVWKLCPTVIRHDETLVQGYPRTKFRLLSERIGRSLSIAISLDSSASETESVFSSPNTRKVGLSGDPTWLYPILLPSITDTLLGLYRAHCEVDGRKLSITLRDLDEKDDEELCELLELQSEYESWKKSEHSKTLAELFHPAMQIFSKIGEYLTPLNKLLCVQETNAEVTQIYKSLHPARDSPLACSRGEEEQLASSRLFSYVIVRSQSHVSCLSSEIEFISDFAGSVLHTEEYGYLLTEVQGCYQQLIDLYVDEEEWT